MNKLMTMYKHYLSENGDGTQDSTPGDDSRTPRDPMRPVSSHGEPQHTTGAAHDQQPRHTEISQSTKTFYDTLPTLASLQQSVDVSYQPESRKTGATRGGNVGSPRKSHHRMGRVRRVTQGATPPSWFQPIGVLLLGVLFMLVGLVLTALGFSVKTMPEATTKFMQIAGPIFLCIGVVSLCGGYAFFTLAYGRHMGANRKDEDVPRPDPNVDMANWGHRQRHPQKNEQAVDLFQAKGTSGQGTSAQGTSAQGTSAQGTSRQGTSGQGTSAQGTSGHVEGATAPPAFSKVSRNKSPESPETSLFVSGATRESSKRLLDQSADRGHLPHLRNLPVGGKGGKLPPINAHLPDSSRDSVRHSGRKKGKSGGDGFNWREDDFEPMPTTPKDPSVFVVGAKPRQNGSQVQSERERGY